LKQARLESYYRINKTKVAVIIQKNVVAILPDIGHTDVVTAKRISAFCTQSQQRKFRCDLPVVGPDV